MYEDRVDRAEQLFRSGFNCSQSVVAAFADLYGFTEEQALKMSASFGAGIGRMRQTCGAACGMFLLAGMETGATRGDDRAGKSRNYAVVQDLAKKYQECTGSLICAELLKLAPSSIQHYAPQAEARSEDYYKKRPCPKMVRTAARIFADFLALRHEDSASGRV